MSEPHRAPEVVSEERDVEVAACHREGPYQRIGVGLENGVGDLAPLQDLLSGIYQTAHISVNQRSPAITGTYLVSPLFATISTPISAPVTAGQIRLRADAGYFAGQLARAALFADVEFALGPDGSRPQANGILGGAAPPFPIGAVDMTPP
jgi:hypothetical protein